VLVSLLDIDSTTERGAITVAIALFDIGEFAKYFNYGRQYLDKLMVKPKIYKLMQKSEDQEIKKEAITCLQKLIVTSWK
jgi:V-type H+-transporting ATPase subunit H